MKRVLNDGRPWYKQVVSGFLKGCFFATCLLLALIFVELVAGWLGLETVERVASVTVAVLMKFLLLPFCYALGALTGDFYCSVMNWAEDTKDEY